MDFITMGIASVAAITVICFLLCQGIKAAGIDEKWCPLLCGGLGAFIGIAGFYLMPDYPAQDIITAIAVGIVSGLAATGVHQLGKQLKR